MKRLRSFLFKTCAVGIAVWALAGTNGPSAQKSWTEYQTRAEVTDFEATSSYEQTIDFLRKLDSVMPEMRLDSFGRSGQGRSLPLVIVSRDRAFTPRTALATGKPIVLIQSGIHAGEIDGKDASLMILRDMALGAHRDVLDEVILLIVPIYNVDGHERVSPYNRPNQDGPHEGMGFRTTADGHDLNRDHLKAETPEARAMIGLFNAWRPHLHVDNHVTNGSDHAWVLTYAWAEAPQAPAPVDAWLRAHMPRVVEATEIKGHLTGPYVSLIDRGDPSRGFNSIVGQPRFATGYYPLRNRPSILVENHSYKPYRDRVKANRDFLVALVEEIAGDPRSLIEAVGRAEQRVVALGMPDAPPSDVVLQYRQAPGDDKVLFPVYDWYTEDSEVFGTPLLHFKRGELRETEVPWVHLVEPELTVTRPRGYLVQPGWPVIEQRLRDHDLQVRRLAEAQEIEVETLRLSRKDDAEGRTGSYQGLTQRNVEVSRQNELRRFPAGTLWIPADQPDFEVAVQLLEPEAPDSMVSWGLLSIVLERKEYIGYNALERLAREMLEDPALAKAWKRALEDKEFAGNARARYLWWYRRTVHWDETVGLMPVTRLLTTPKFETTAWK